MRRVLTMMYNALTATWQALQGWLQGLSVDPTRWSGFTWALVALAAVLVLVLLLRPRKPASRRPELLISHGELVIADEEADDAFDRAAAATSAPAGCRTSCA